MDKHYESLCSYTRKKLGYLLNTRPIIVAIAPGKCFEIWDILSTDWHARRRSFTLREASLVLGIIQFLATCTSWGKCLYISLQQSIYKTLKFNAQFVLESATLSQFTQLLHYKNRAMSTFFQSIIIS